MICNVNGKKLNIKLVNIFYVYLWDQTEILLNMKQLYKWLKVSILWNKPFNIYIYIYTYRDTVICWIFIWNFHCIMLSLYNWYRNNDLSALTN